MKKALVLTMVLVTGLALATFAGPYIGLRHTWGGDVSPLAGGQYTGEIGIFAEAYKANFWDFTVDGSYMLEGGITVPFYLRADHKVPLGVACRLDVIDREPGWAFTTELFGFTGLWLDGGNGNMLRFDLYFNAETLLPAFGFHVDLYGLWRTVFGQDQSYGTVGGQ